ncbi:MAG: hypothetical protein ACYDC6_12375 [Acidobacteriaceae bacterium]
MNWLSLLTVLGNTTLLTLQTAGVVNPAVSALALTFEQTVMPLIANLSAGQSKLSDVLAVLAAVQGTLTTLRKQTGLSALQMDAIGLAEAMVTGGIDGYMVSQKGLDLASLSPIPLVS